MAEVDPNDNNPDDTPPVTSASRSKPNLTDLERNNILLDLVKEGGENWQLQRGAIARIAKARGTSWQTVMRLWRHALETSGPAHTGTVDVSSRKTSQAGVHSTTAVTVNNKKTPHARDRCRTDDDHMMNSCLWMQMIYFGSE